MFKLNTALHSFDLNLESLAALDFVKNEDGSFFFVHNEQVYTLRILKIEGKKLTISVNGKSIEYTIADELDLLIDKLGFSVAETERIDEIKAPMPGLVLKIMVSNDEEVQEGLHSAHGRPPRARTHQNDGGQPVHQMQEGRRESH